MKTLFTLTLTLIMGVVFGQIETPMPSPLGKVEQKVGLTDCSIEYSRPSVKDRKIFGELVPFGKMWRTGANASTKIKFSDPVKIAGKDVPAGTYALYTIPSEDEWTIILHKNLTYWGVGGSDYNPEEDQLRFKVKANKKYPVKIETMTFNFANVSATGCDIELLWENTQVKFRMDVTYDDKVMAQIEQAMTISSRTYYAAARYYLENDKDLNKALEWINKATEGEEVFWMLRQKALILAKMENYTEAISVAKRSKELAQEAGNENYVKMNEDSIKEWSEK